MMKITDLSILCKWENLKNRQFIKNYLPHCIYIYILLYIFFYEITFMDLRLCPVESILSILLASNVILHCLNYMKPNILKKEIQSTRITQ